MTPTGVLNKDRFQRVRSITLPQLKIKDHTEYFVKFIGAMALGDKITIPQGGNARGDEATRQARMEPPTLAKVINLETGEEMQIVVNSVLKSELEKHYPEQVYVGKCFGFSVWPIENKRYKGISLYEVQDTQAAQAETSRASADNGAKGGKK